METYQNLQAMTIVGMAAEIMTTLKMKVVEVVGIPLRGAEMNTKKVEYKIKD